jgi:hypothetical protein
VRSYRCSGSAHCFWDGAAPPEVVWSQSLASSKRGTLSPLHGRSGQDAAGDEDGERGRRRVTSCDAWVIGEGISAISAAGAGAFGVALEVSHFASFLS